MRKLKEHELSENKKHNLSESRKHGKHESYKSGKHDRQEQSESRKHKKHGLPDNVKTTFVRLKKRVPGVLYEPAEYSDNEHKNIAVLVMHSDEDYLTFPTGAELAKRGFKVLCANVLNKEGIVFNMSDKIGCVAEAVQFLKDKVKADKVILMGHSGGATLMSAYQCVAENGEDVFDEPSKLYPFRARHKVPAADGIMLLDANWGNSVMQLFSLDPAVIDETGGMKLNKDIDLFNENNGFNKSGSSFSAEFISCYQQAQGERNMRLVNAALERLKLIEEGKGKYDDDEPFIIPGAAQSFFNNKLYAQDIRLMAHTQKAQLLIHPDGSITTEIVHSVRHPENPESMTHSFWEGARFLSVRTYLSDYAVRTEDNFGYDADHVWGIDWNSTYSAVPGNIAKIGVPTLVMGMTGGWEYLASETIYNLSAAKDKHLAFVEGASHKFNPATEYEEYPGQFGDTMKTIHDYVANWLLEDGRFIHSTVFPIPIR